MARRNYFTPEEIILCAYAAMYEADDFSGIRRIESLTHRSAASIKMKIQDIAAMLDEAGIRRYSAVSPLTGRPPGEHGRTTNWEQVEPLTRLSRDEFLASCRSIVTVNWAVKAPPSHTNPSLNDRDDTCVSRGTRAQ